MEVEKQDQCALGFDHKESLAKHESQQGISLRPLYPQTLLLCCLRAETHPLCCVQMCRLINIPLLKKQNKTKKNRRPDFAE